MRVAPWTSALAVTLAASAGAESLPREMQAKWTLDKAATIKALPAFAGFPPEKQKQLIEKAEKDMPDMSVEFTSARVRFGIGPDQRQEGSYRVLGSENGVVRLAITSKGPDGKDSTDETSAELLSSDALKLTKTGDRTVLLFRRVK